MLVELPVRGVRVGGVTVGPGEARMVSIPLAARRRAEGAGAARSIPVWVVVGNKAGPRVSVVGAVRGVEASAARAASRLAASLDPAAVHGSVVVAPVLRPGGRLSRAGRAGAAWRFPGDAGGKRRQRDAFTLFSDVVVSAHALVVLGGPLGGRQGAVVARGRLADPRVKRLALATGALVVLPAPARSRGLLAAAAAARIPAIELSAEGDGDEAASGGSVAGVSGAGESASGETAAGEGLLRAARAALAALGTFGKDAGEVSGANGAGPPIVVDPPLRVTAPAAGFLEAPVTVGTRVRARATVGELTPLLPGSPHKLEAPADGLVIEAAPPGPTRAGATLFRLVPLPRAAFRRRAGASGGGGTTTAERSGDVGSKTRVGWVEEVGLPALGIARLKAKIDTGARTSALHVARMRTVDTTGGPHGRPILEITVPRGGRGHRPVVVRAAVREFASVRDTSGRTERRPVIETAIQLGPIKRRIAVTLTNRGDMLFPMLIGRTALGPGVVVDPARRYLLRR